MEVSRGHAARASTSTLIPGSILRIPMNSRTSVSGPMDHSIGQAIVNKHVQDPARGPRPAEDRR